MPYCSETVTYSAMLPSPRKGFMTTPKTASPGANRVTPSPTAP